VKPLPASLRRTSACRPYWESIRHVSHFGGKDDDPCDVLDTVGGLEWMLSGVTRRQLMMMELWRREPQQVVWPHRRFWSDLPALRVPHPYPAYRRAVCPVGVAAAGSPAAHSWPEMVIWSNPKPGSQVPFPVGVFRTMDAPAEPSEYETLCHALRARAAAIAGQDETVDEFAQTWPRRHRPTEWREAVALALMQDWLYAYTDKRATAPLALRQVYEDARVFHKQHLPLWERKVLDRRLEVLGDTPMAASDGTPEDQVVGAEVADHRVMSVLSGLQPDEAAVVAAWLQGDDRTTWAEAAAALDVPEPTAFGERVRRKLKRLGDRHTARAATARRTAEGDR